MNNSDQEKGKCPVEDISSQDMERMMNMFNKLQPGDSMLYCSCDGALLSIHRESQPLDNDDRIIRVFKDSEGNELFVIRRTYRDPEGNELVVHDARDFVGDECTVYCMSFVSYTPKSGATSDEQETEDEDN